MNVIYLRRRLFLATVACLVCGLLEVAGDEPNLTKEQIKQFLVTAKVVKSHDSKKGSTNTSRLTLSDGTITHDASFQPIDEHKREMKLASGAVEMNFVDSYKYNIAAYALAEMLGIDDMLPVYVERKLEGKKGSLSWWLPVKMDAAERYKQKIQVPDPDGWNNQMHKIWIFDQLISDSDANLTNLVIGENWQIWRIDFSRAFRLNKEPKDNKELVRCDRQLLQKLKALDRNSVTEKTKGYLTKDEVEAVMMRRDNIVAYVQKLIAEKGENQVLY
jgi:hypothetical protein